MKKVIARFEHNICLNPKEYILEDDNATVKEFNNVDEALKFLEDKAGDKKTAEQWEEEGIYIEDATIFQ